MNIQKLCWIIHVKLCHLLSTGNHRWCLRLPSANVGVCVLTSDPEHRGMLHLYGSLQLYSFQWVYTCASCSLFIGTAVYSERFRDNLPGLEEPSVAAIPDCFGGVSINRGKDARRRVLAKHRAVGSRDGLHTPYSFRISSISWSRLECGSVRQTSIQTSADLHRSPPALEIWNPCKNFRTSKVKLGARQFLWCQQPS